MVTIGVMIRGERGWEREGAKKAFWSSKRESRLE